jgi:hypothetical protein
MKKLIFAALLVASTGALSAFTVKTVTAVKHDTVVSERKDQGTADERKDQGTADARAKNSTNERKDQGTAD